jgi:LysM repeat protein
MNNPSPNPSPNPNPIPSPLVPQGTMLDPKNVGRARVRLAVFFIISVHVIGLMALLMQGCRKPAETVDTAGTETNTMMPPPELNSNLPPVEPNVATASNTAVPPLVDNTAMTTTTPGAGQEYTVQKGDSFYSIAKKFSVTMKAIQESNPTVQPTKLQPGQKLRIPATTAAVTTSTTAVPEANNGEITYTVKSGDTLTKIAADHGTTVKAIRSANPTLTTDKIVVGQKLKIPARTAAPAPAPVPAPVAPAPAPVH